MTEYKQELGLFEDIPIEQYHGGPGLSSSSIKMALDALKLHRAYETGQIQSEDTPTTIFGSAVHCAVLEPEKFDDLYAIVPGDKKKPTSAQLNAKKPSADTILLINWWNEFNSCNEGKSQIKQEERDNAMRVRDAVWEHPEAKEYFFDYKTELSGYYLDQDFENGQGTNMLCRYRPDLRTDDYILDLKTTVCAKKDEFMRSIGKFGYHISAAHYLEGDRILKGTTHKHFVFVAVEKKPPYLVGVYKLSQRDLELGLWQRRKALNDIKKAREEKHWPGYNNDIAVETQLSPYMFYDFELSKI